MHHLTHRVPILTLSSAHWVGLANYNNASVADDVLISLASSNLEVYALCVSVCVRACEREETWTWVKYHVYRKRTENF